MHLRVCFLLIVAFTACKETIIPVQPIRITINGREYQTVKIGNQTWTTTNYAGAGGVGFDTVNSKPEYGKYYSKAEIAVITLPSGWRIPTQQDFETLATVCGIVVPSHGTHTSEIKALISSTNWNHVQGTNTAGFNAHPAGYIFGTSSPIDGDIAEFWTAEGITLSIQEAGASFNLLRIIFYDSNNSPEYRFNIRFVKD